jgi:hypothetical protein
VLVGHVGAIAAAEAIDLADQSEGGASQFEVEGLAILVGTEGGMELPACKDGGIGDADLLDLFEVKEAWAIGECMEGHDANGRLMVVDERERRHRTRVLFRVR